MQSKSAIAKFLIAPILGAFIALASTAAFGYVCANVGYNVSRFYFIDQKMTPNNPSRQQIYAESDKATAEAIKLYTLKYLLDDGFRNASIGASLGLCLSLLLKNISDRRIKKTTL